MARYKLEARLTPQGSKRGMTYMTHCPIRGLWAGLVADGATEAVAAACLDGSEAIGRQQVGGYGHAVARFCCSQSR